jgi:hypothetical protein
MTQDEVIKKKRRQRRISEKDGQGKMHMPFPTLARIVSRNGSLVCEIPELPSNILELTIYDNLRVAMEYAALTISCLNSLRSRMTPALADNYNLAPIRQNLEDLMNHLYYAIKDYPETIGSF